VFFFFFSFFLFFFLSFHGYVVCMYICYRCGEIQLKDYVVAYTFLPNVYATTTIEIVGA